MENSVLKWMSIHHMHTKEREEDDSIIHAYA